MKIPSKNIVSTRLAGAKATENKFYTSLSKQMAFALRHKPEQCGLALNKEGFTPVKALLQYLKSLIKFKDVTLKDIKAVLANIDKKRFELKKGQIRAYYGHTCKQRIVKPASTPPNVLYHGTSNESAKIILKQGIKPQKRQYVHVSTDIDSARKVGVRKAQKPVVLRIDSQKASKEGIKFYAGNKNTWLANQIPAKYICYQNNKQHPH